MNGRHRLSQWLHNEGLTQGQLAQVLGVSRQTVNYWIGGRCKPDICKAFWLEKATGGHVPAKSWTERDDVEATE